MDGIATQAGMVRQAGGLTFADVVNADSPLATRNLTLTPEVFDGATSFEIGNSSDYDALVTENAFTLEGVVSVDSVAADGTVIGKWGNAPTEKKALLWFDAGGSPNFRGIFHSGGGVGATEESSVDYTVAVRQEYHVVYTYDGANAKIYLDGELRDSVPVTNQIDGGPATLNVGDEGSSLRFLTGTGRGYAIYDYALSAARVLAHYNASGI